jgi:hypothetical protein
VNEVFSCSTCPGMPCILLFTFQDLVIRNYILFRHCWNSAIKLLTACYKLKIMWIRLKKR